MHYVTGNYSSRSGKFVPYTVNDFILELTKLQTYGYKEFEKDLLNLCSNSGVSIDEFMRFTLPSDDGKTFRTHSLFDMTGATVRSDGWAIMDNNYFSTTFSSITEVRRVLGYHVSNNLKGPVIRDALTGKPSTRHINSYTNRLPIFEFFINSRDSHLYDKSIPENRVVISFGYYIGKPGNYTNIYKQQNVDTFFRITKRTPISNTDGSTSWYYDGVLDIEGHLPYVLDHFYALKIREAVRALQKGPTVQYVPDDLIYLMSPEHRIATGLLDKLKMNMAYKTSRPKPIDLKNSLTKALLRDIKLLTGDINRQIQTVCRIKILPLNATMSEDRINYKYYNTGIESDAASNYYKGSYFFNWFDPNYKAKSWSDAFSSEINFSVDQFRDTIEAFKLTITFLSEKAMVDGVFCVDTTEFKSFLLQDPTYAPLISKCISHDVDVSTNILSHVFMRHGHGLEKHFEEIISIANVTEEMRLSPLAYLNACKKWNQRKKLVVAEKFPTSYKDFSNHVKVGDLGSELEFRRDVCGLSYELEHYFKKDPFHINALVGFHEDDFSKIDITIDQYTNMTAQELNVFHSKLEGVSCDGWFTNSFLHGIELVAPRTMTINSKDCELSNNMLDYIKHLDKLATATESDPIVIEIENEQYRTDALLSHYTTSCSHCASRMVEGDEFTEGAKMLASGEFSFVRPESKAFFCPLCENYSVNPAAGYVTNKGDNHYHEDAIVEKNYISSGRGKFNKIIIKGYKRHEDGLDLRVEVYYDLANARATSPDILKFIFLERSNKQVGVVKELKVRDPETGEIRIFKNVQLDGIITGGANKAKDVAIMNAALRLNALVFGRKRSIENNTIVAPHEQFDIDGESMDLPFVPENVYYPNKYISVDEPDFSLKEINEKIIQHLTRCEVLQEVWDSEQKKFVDKISHMYVGISALNATEISQEFNTIYTLENPRKISLNNSYHLYQLGFHTLNEKLYAQNYKSYYQGFAKDSHTSEIDLELLRILGTLLLPLKNNDEYCENDDEMFRYVQDLDAKRNSENKIGKLSISDFSQLKDSRVAITNWLSYAEYKKIEKSHPMFNLEKFINGTYGYFTFSNWVMTKGHSGVKHPVRVEERYCLRFPSAKLMHYLLDISANGLKVRLNEIYTAFLNLFETISTSSYDEQSNGIMPALKSNQKKSFVTLSAINQLKKAILNHFLTKKGAFAQNLAINLPAIGAKQTASALIPEFTIVIGDDRDYKRVISDVLTGLYPDRTQDWRISYGNDGYDYIGWCWTADVYALAHRDPVIWSGQNFPCIAWSRHKANIELKKLTGQSYDELFPGCKSISINSAQMVKDQESDVDGDWLCAIFPYMQDTVFLIKEYIEEAKDNGFYKDESYYVPILAALNEEPILNQEKISRYENYKLFSNMTRNVKFSYLMGEAESLYHSYSDKLVYDLTNSKVSLRQEVVALLEGTEAKKDIGFLTNSCTMMTLTTNLLKKSIENDPTRFTFVITNEDETAITFIFQYLLLQRNGVRAVKADGSFGKLTFNAIITNSYIRTLTDNDPVYKPARDLFRQLLNEYDDECGTNLKKYYKVVIDICDKFMISDQPDWGGGYIRKALDKPDSYGRMEIIQLDRNGKNISPWFRDFLGLFHLIVGSSYTTFARIHGEDAIFKGVYNETLLKIPMLKYVGTDVQSLVKGR